MDEKFREAELPPREAVLHPSSRGEAVLHPGEAVLPPSILEGGSFASPGGKTASQGGIFASLNFVPFYHKSNFVGGSTRISRFSSNSKGNFLFFVRAISIFAKRSSLQTKN